MKREQAFRGILEQAIGEMREALSQETAGDGDAQWDPDSWEQEVRRFTRRLGQELVQVWGEVKAEQSQAQSPFVLSAEEDATCSGGALAQNLDLAQY